MNHGPMISRSRHLLNLQLANLFAHKRSRQPKHHRYSCKMWLVFALERGKALVNFRDQTLNRGLRNQNYLDQGVPDQRDIAQGLGGLDDG